MRWFYDRTNRELDKRGVSGQRHKFVVVVSEEKEVARRAINKSHNFFSLRAACADVKMVDAAAAARREAAEAWSYCAPSSSGRARVYVV